MIKRNDNSLTEGNPTSRMGKQKAIHPSKGYGAFRKLKMSLDPGRCEIFPICLSHTSMNHQNGLKSEVSSIKVNHAKGLDI